MNIELSLDEKEVLKDFVSVQLEMLKELTDEDSEFETTLIEVLNRLSEQL